MYLLEGYCSLEPILVGRALDCIIADWAGGPGFDSRFNTQALKKLKLRYKSKSYLIPFQYFSQILRSYFSPIQTL